MIDWRDRGTTIVITLKPSVGPSRIKLSVYRCQRFSDQFPGEAISDRFCEDCRIAETFYQFKYLGSRQLAYHRMMVWGRALAAWSGSWLLLSPKVWKHDEVFKSFQNIDGALRWVLCVGTSIDRLNRPHISQWRYPPDLADSHTLPNMVESFLHVRRSFLILLCYLLYHHE